MHRYLHLQPAPSNTVRNVPLRVKKKHALNAMILATLSLQANVLVSIFLSLIIIFQTCMVFIWVAYAKFAIDIAIPHSPRLFLAKYSLNSAESWPKTKIIHSFIRHMTTFHVSNFRHIHKSLYMYL